MKYINYSGGAVGSDSLWESEGEKYGVKTVAYSFYGHNISSKNRWTLTQQQLDDGFTHVEIANKSLKRNIYNISTYVKNLLSRNWFQVRESDCIYAIGILKSNREVLGGTGWAVSMGIDNNKPIYVFEQNENSWYEYIKDGDTENDKFTPSGKFLKISHIPKLSENFAGIGTRDINENAKKAIIELYRANFNKPFQFFYVKNEDEITKTNANI